MTALAIASYGLIVLAVALGLGIVRSIVDHHNSLWPQVARENYRRAMRDAERYPAEISEDEYR